MKNTNRYIALALCFTLTLGAFAYRPSEAKALAGVDDAVVIGALLSAFAGGCGLIFSNNGMTSGELAQGLTDKWNEFKVAVLETDITFAGWLGYEDMDALLQAIVLSGGNALTVPRLVARKFADFTTWLTDNLGVTAGGEAVPAVVSPASTALMAKRVAACLKRMMGDSYDFYKEYPYYSGYKVLSNGSGIWEDPYVFLSSKYPFEVQYKTVSDGYPENAMYIICSQSGQDVSARSFLTLNEDDWHSGTTLRAQSGTKYIKITVGEIQSSDSDLSVFAPSYYKNPTIDLPAEGEEAANPTLSGVGDGTATAIEDLLQQILAQLQANTLAPTLDLAGTETGGNTGTDEDAKPYLPYIPQIFEKIKELPGTLANIWESIKGIPAAIAEKIGAFFTTLWGWLQSIIDAITALPAAIAEKIKALFVPREGYAAEFVADITATYQGRMGLLTYPFTVLADFVGTVATLEEQEPVLRWDAVEWQNKTIIAAGEYNLKSAVSSAQMQTVYMIYKTVVSGMLIVAFLHLCYKKLKEVQRN